MDWPSTETLFNDNHFGNFKYEPRSFKIVRKLYTDKELECWDIKSPRDLKQWIEKNRHLLRESYQDGTVAILFSRGGNADYSHTSYLPVTKSGFNELIGLFQIHPSIVRTIRREMTSFSYTLPYHHNPDTSTVAYTARMCSQWPDDIAMSSTYLIDRRLNLSVYYGCSEQQSLDLMDRLSRAGNAILHPMIASGILAELDRKRLFECVELATDAFVSSTEMLCCPSISPETVIDQEGQNMTQLSDLYNNSRELAKNIRKVECQISDMRTHICDFDARESQGHRSLKSKKPTREKFDAYLNASSPGTQIHARLLEIENEYEDKLNTCSMIPDSLAFTAQIAANHANNRMAYDTQTKNTQMRTIALMTMIYLPVTSVASIFSMGVFNWTASEQQSVLTSYFWVYVAVAGCLTVLTLGIWWTLTRAQRRQYDSDIDIEKLM